MELVMIGACSCVDTCTTRTDSKAPLNSEAMVRNQHLQFLLLATVLLIITSNISVVRTRFLL